MAYNNYGGAQKKTAPATGNTAQKGTEQKAAGTPPLYSTGLFKSDSGPSIATVKVREDIHIPAGSFINLYQSELESDDPTKTMPTYRIVVKAGKKT